MKIKFNSVEDRDLVNQMFDDWYRNQLKTERPNHVYIVNRFLCAVSEDENGFYIDEYDENLEIISSKQQIDFTVIA